MEVLERQILREKKKADESRSGAGSSQVFKPAWADYNLFAFLRDTFDRRETDTDYLCELPSPAMVGEVATFADSAPASVAASCSVLADESDVMSDDYDSDGDDEDSNIVVVPVDSPAMTREKLGRRIK